MTAALFLLIAVLGFLPGFGFLNAIIDPSFFMIGVVWYILVSGVWADDLSLVGILTGKSYSKEIINEEPTPFFINTCDQVEDEDYEEQESMIEDPTYCCTEMPDPFQGLDENELQDGLEDPLPTQAEFDWVSSARSGQTKLTDEVYRAAVQWWLQQQHCDRFEWLSSEDQRLMKPVATSLQHGDVAKAHLLVEKLGQLDKVERDIQRGGTQAPGCATRETSPLSRASSSPTEAAARLRKAIESYMPPDDEAPSSHWHMSWKKKRRGLADHLFVGCKNEKDFTCDGVFAEQCSTENVHLQEGIGVIGNFGCMGA